MVQGKKEKMRIAHTAYIVVSDRGNAHTLVVNSKYGI